jgi:hypothetical protein
MVDRAEREPTMDEIVVALRETRRAAGHGPPFTVVDGRHAGNPAVEPTDDAQSAANIAELRDSEIQRLLTENARLNERVMLLLKVIEQEQPHNHANIAAEVSNDAILRDVRATLAAELRPVLDVLLRLLEKLHAYPVRHQPHNDGGIIDLDAPRAHE